MPPGPIYPPPLIEVVGGLRESRYPLNALRDIERWKYLTPKGLAIALIVWAFFTHNGYVTIYGLAAAIVIIIIDAVWKDRVFRHEVAELGSKQLWDLIEELPELWAKECAARGPELALAEILAYIRDRRQHLGELGVKDLGLRPWSSES